MALKVATVSETVSVSAEVALTPLNSGEKSATLTAEQIENIPIMGTSAAEVLRLLPGMTATGGDGAKNNPGFSGEIYGINGNGEGGKQSAVGNYSANGARDWALDITIDGAPGADPGCNCATSVNPNTEFIQEFKVLQSNFSAEHAKGPVAMSVISKSGGREFHGSVFGYLRDYRLNSNEWFANKVGADRVKNKFIYPGFTLSGPLLIPGTGFNKNRDKVFFFAGFEYFGQTLDTGYVKSWVPTAAMRNGDFTNPGAVGSGSFVNTPTNFPGGIVPANMIDPGGQAMLNLFPNPNADPATTGGYNYVDNLLVDQNGWQGLARLDFNISDNTKMFVRYNIQRETQPFVIGLWWRNGERQVPYPSSISGKNKSDSVTASLTHVFNPTLTNETILAVTYIDFPNQIDDRNAVSRQALGYPYQGIFGDSNDQIPSADAGGWGNSGPMYFNPGGFDPILFATKWQVSAQNNLTKVWGLHTMKFGAYYEYVSNAQPRNNNSNGNAIFATWQGGSSGNTFADLLMGGPMAAYNEASKNIVADMSYNLFEAYAQDSWKIKPRLTLDYGLRVSYFGPWSDNNGIGMAAWDETKYGDGSGQFPGIVWNAKDSSVPLSGVDGELDLRDPARRVRLGPEGHRRDRPPRRRRHVPVPRAAAHLVQPPRGRRRGEDLRRSRRPHAGPDRRPRRLRQPGVRRPGDRRQRQRAAAGLQLEPHPQPEAALVDEHRGRLRREQAGQHREHRHRQPQRGAAVRHARQPDRQREPLPAAAGLRGPAGLPPQRVLELPRPADPAEPPAGELQLHGRLHVLEDPRDPLGLDGHRSCRACPSEYLLPARDYVYGVLGSDRTHVASVSFSWMLKEFKDNKTMDLFLGGWQFAGVATYVSAPPLQASANNNFDVQGTNAEGVEINNRNINGTTSIDPFPVLTCDPSKDVPSGYMFNTACFAAPNVGQLGNTVMPYIKGNAYKNLDLSLFKNFSIGSKGQKTPAPHLGVQRAQPRDLVPGRRAEPDPPVRERRAEQPELRQDQRGQQVRPAHRAARAALHLLGLTTGRSNRAGVATGGARLFRSGRSYPRGRERAL